MLELLVVALGCQPQNIDQSCGWVPEGTNTGAIVRSAYPTKPWVGNWQLVTIQNWYGKPKSSYRGSGKR